MMKCVLRFSLKPLCFLACVLWFPTQLLAQQSDTLTGHSPKRWVHFKAGISHKVEASKVVDENFLPQPGDATAYTDAKQNILGPTLNLGAEINIYSWNTALEYRMGIRYDHVYNKSEIGSIFLESVNQLLYEHHFLVNQSFGRGALQPFLTTGVSFLNRGAVYQVNINNRLIEYDLKYTAFNLGLGFQLNQFSVAFRNYMVGSGSNPFIEERSFESSPNLSIQEFSLHYTF